MLLLEIIIIIDKPFSYLCWLLSLNFIKCYKNRKKKYGRIISYQKMMIVTILNRKVFLISNGLVIRIINIEYFAFIPCDSFATQSHDIYIPQVSEMIFSGFLGLVAWITSNFQFIHIRLVADNFLGSCTGVNPYFMDNL